MLFFRMQMSTLPFPKVATSHYFYFKFTGIRKFTRNQRNLSLRGFSLKILLDAIHLPTFLSLLDRETALVMANNLASRSPFVYLYCIKNSRLKCNFRPEIRNDGRKSDYGSPAPQFPDRIAG